MFSPPKMNRISRGYYVCRANGPEITTINRILETFTTFNVAGTRRVPFVNLKHGAAVQLPLQLWLHVEEEQ
jgi:hypothetical protein